MNADRKHRPLHHFDSKHDPEHTETVLNLAVLYRLKRDYANAAQLIDAILGKDPELPVALEQQVFLRETQGKVLDAIAILQRILVLTQKTTYSHSESEIRSRTLANLGLAFNSVGKYDEAIRIWDQLSAFSPSQAAFAARQKANSWLNEDQKPKAFATLEDAMQRFPDNADLVITHAFLLLRSDQLDKASSELNRFVRQQPTFGTWLAVATVAERQRDFIWSGPQN